MVMVLNSGGDHIITVRHGFPLRLKLSVVQGDTSGDSQKDG